MLPPVAIISGCVPSTIPPFTHPRGTLQKQPTDFNRSVRSDVLFPKGRLADRFPVYRGTSHRSVVAEGGETLTGVRQRCPDTSIEVLLCDLTAAKNDGGCSKSCTIVHASIPKQMGGIMCFVGFWHHVD